jgi:hypothetical protein
MAGKNYTMPLDSKVTLSWDVDDAADEITIQATFRKNSGWAGLGIN